MAVTTDQLLEKLNVCIDELQKAEITVVEALKALTAHNTDPQAHLNLSNSGLELTVTKLSEQVLVLTQAVADLESKSIEQDAKIARLESAVNISNP